MRHGSLSLTSMAFQDAGNLNIERLRRCSLHVYDRGKNQALLRQISVSHALTVKGAAGNENRQPLVYGSRNASTSSILGIEEEAPGRVTAMAEAAAAILRASGISFP